MGDAEIHFGGRMVATPEVRLEPDPVRPGRVLARVRGEVTLNVVLAHREIENTLSSEVALYANGARVSLESEGIQRDRGEGTDLTIAHMRVDVGALVIVDPDGLAPIFSRAEFGTDDLRALVAALPRCAECLAEAGPVGKADKLNPALWLMSGRKVCRMHAFEPATALPYQCVVEAIERRLREPIFRGYGPESTKETP